MIHVYPSLFVLAMLLTFLVRRWVMAKNIVDIPNERSSHAVPTPRGGGVAIAVSYLLFCFYLASVADGLVFNILVVGGVAGILALLGFWDDLVGLSPRFRLSVQVMVVMGGLLAIGDIWLYQYFPFEALGILVAAIAVLWWINLFNFMDGIDGIAAVEVISLAIGALVLQAASGLEGMESFWLALVACVAGFLVFNWPPAKIFMGDVGSYFLGGAVAMLALLSVQSQLISVWSWVILTAVFWADATFTLLRRFARGESLSNPHRCHAYQILSRRFGSHAVVTFGVLVINLLWLLPMALLAASSTSHALLVVLISVAPLFILLWFVGAGDSRA